MAQNPETAVRNAIRLACGAGTTRLFNNPVGEAWTGREVERNEGRLVLAYPRRVVYGLAPGSADLVGWHQVTITPDMVGRDAALFLSIEVKAGRGRPTDDQIRFLAAVRAAGGISGIARSPEEAAALIAGGGLL